MQQIFSSAPKLARQNLKSIGKISGSFKLATTPEDHENPKADPFLISTSRGFFPRKDPILETPPKYEVVDSLLRRMKWFQADGTQGLLAKNVFGETLKRELPQLDVEGIKDTMTEVALFRDYCYLASAYILEECHHSWLKSSTYGLGRDHLPSTIAKPLVRLAEKLKFHPFLEYNSGYALNNFKRIDKDKEASITNVIIERTFTNLRSEVGFIHVHVGINQHGGRLVQSGVEVLNSVESNDRVAFNESLQEMKNVLMFMNQEFDRMYFESNSEEYNIFRTFILGILNQPMFPNGVVYEGCFDNKPQYYRGESGANDSIIPFCDNILQITKSLPKNPLTDILRDFRAYRPKQHQEFLTWSEDAANSLGVLEYAKQNPESMVALLEVADQVRAFRHTHWVLTNLYIIRKSSHPVATGGSPIITWLPNQLLAVIDFIKENEKYAVSQNLPSNLQYSLNAIVSRANSDERIVTRERDDKRKIFKQ